MGFTSGLANAGSDDAHSIEVRASGITKRALLPDLPAKDYMKNKGDLWIVPISRLGFVGCIRKANIETIAIEESGNDGWNIESMVTFVRSGSSYELATMDFHVNKWIDGNGLSSHHRLDLTLQL